MPQTAEPRRDPELSIPLDVVSYIVERAKEFDAKEADSDPDSGSNATDDGEADVLEDKPGDLVQRELVNYINVLNVDQQVELVALAWLGRGTYDIDEWEEAKATARQEHNSRTGEYLSGLPLLGDYLQEGLDAFGESIVDTDDTRDAPPDTDNA
jgi:hypothetical protein